MQMPCSGGVFTIFLESQTTILNWLFQLDDSKPLHDSRRSDTSFLTPSLRLLPSFLMLSRSSPFFPPFPVWGSIGPQVGPSSLFLVTWGPPFLKARFGGQLGPKRVLQVSFLAKEAELKSDKLSKLFRKTCVQKSNAKPM